MLTAPNAKGTPTIIAWIVLIVLINFYWMFWDFYICPRRNWRMLTIEFRDGLNTPLGCLIGGGIAFVAVTFILHMYNVRTG